MTAEALLGRLAALGVRVAADGERLRLSADAPPPPDLLAEVRAAKAGVLAVLRTGAPLCSHMPPYAPAGGAGPEREIESAPEPDGDGPEAWQRFVTIRAATRWARYGAPSAFAYSEAVPLWHLRHGARPDPNRCAGCGGPIGAVAWTLPDGARLHDDRRAVDCLAAYGRRWRTAAADGLAAAGVHPVTD